MKRMKNVIYLWMIHWEWRLVRSYVNSWDWVLWPDKEKWCFFFKDLCISTVETGFFPFFLHKLGHWNCIRSPKSYSSSFFRQHWRMKSFAVCDSCYFFWGQFIIINCAYSLMQTRESIANVAISVEVNQPNQNCNGNLFAFENWRNENWQES